MENDGINLDDVLRVGGGREEIRQAAEDVKLFSRKLKRRVNLRVCGVLVNHLSVQSYNLRFDLNYLHYFAFRKVVEVGETTLATEKELDELRQIMKAGKKGGRTDGSAWWSISDVEREVELVRLRCRIALSSPILLNVEIFSFSPIGSKVCGFESQVRIPQEVP